MSHHYIKYTDVRFAYTGEDDEVLKGVSFLITHGERVALLGLNGAGKSTLLHTLNGLLMPTGGEVNVGGFPLGKNTLNRIRQSVGMVFQNPDDQLFMPSVEEDVAFGPINMKLPREEIEKRVKHALEEVGLWSLRHRNPSQLSGGQKRMAAVATVLSMEPDIMVLDEPTANLDWKARGELTRVLDKYRHTLLMATHDLQLAGRLCNRAIVLSNGRVASDTSMETFLSSPELLKLIGIDVAEEAVCGSSKHFKIGTEGPGIYNPMSN